MAFGPGNSSVMAAGNGPPIQGGLSKAPVKTGDARRNAILRRLGSRTAALAAGKLDNMPDDKTSFEGI